MMYGPCAQDQGTEDQLAQLGRVLPECATHVTEGCIWKTNLSLREITRLTSIADGPLQRLSTIIADSLSRRLVCHMEGIAGALIHPSDYFEQSSIQAARWNFATLIPYLRSGFVTINRAILEAMEGEKVVRIIDLSCSTTLPWQWCKLLHDFHGRPGGAPDLRLTVVHDNNEFLAEMQALLSKEADALKMPFHFDCVIGRLETLDFSNLRNSLKIKFGEAIAISCALQMHRLLVVDDDVSWAGIAQLQHMANIARLKQMASSVYSPACTLNYPQTPSPQCQMPNLLVSFLSAIRALKPNIMVMMEQDANHNALLFCDRFGEALRYYAALFDSLHEAAAANPRRTDERVRVERMLLGEEIKNILMCEGVRRHERHEKLSQWAMHMEESGFGHVPLSFSAIREGKEVLTSSGLKGFQHKEEYKGCLLLCWGSTSLYSISAWRPHKGSTSGSREHLSAQRQAIWPAQPSRPLFS